MLLCLASYEQCNTQLLKTLHKRCNTDILRVLLIYLHSPLGTHMSAHCYILYGQINGRIICVLGRNSYFATAEKAKKGNTASCPQHCVVIRGRLFQEQVENCLHDGQGDWSSDPGWLRDGLGPLYAFLDLLQPWSKLLMKKQCADR